jgi:putative DNA primase/helicase
MRDTLIRISENFRYDPRLVRRVGIWKDEAGNVIHLGDRVMTEQGIVKLSEFKSSHIYEYAEKTVRIPGYRNPLPKERASKIIDFCAGSYWSDPISPRILAGWIFSSLICASIRWRSHLYIVGPAGSGKSWLMNNVVSKILGDFACQAISSSTEASIRQGLANNMVPVVFDEAEAKDMNAGARREAIFELARQASSSHENTPITKGSSGGATKDYFVRSPFLFASINANMEYADESRTTFLYLRPIPKTPEVRPKFRELNSLVRRTLTPDFHAGLLARALKLLPSMEKSFEVFSDAAYETIAQDSRHAEQMAFMIVGLWYLENDHQPDRDEAVRFVSNMTYMSQQRKATMTTEERLIAAISQCIVRYRLSNGIVEERIIGELVKTAYFEGGMGHAEDILRRYGLMTKGNRLFVCNHAENLKKSLRNTPFFNGWDKVIITIKGAKDEGTQTFMPGLIGPTVSIPMKSLIGEVNQEKSPEESF